MDVEIIQSLRKILKKLEEGITATVSEFPSEYPLPDSQVQDLKEVSVNNLPSEYPLPSSQVSDLKNVSVSNFPSEYPLPSTQETKLKNKIRVMAWDESQNKYVLIEGYEGQKSLTWTNGNLTELQMKVIKDDGTEVTIKRTFSYDAQGNLISVGRWEIT